MKKLIRMHHTCCKKRMYRMWVNVSTLDIKVFILTI